jgi:phycocyanobilin:ferredoxin oxidoreductase
MSEVWNNLINIQDFLITQFDKSGTEIQEEGMEIYNKNGWINRVWTSNSYRRAHIDVVDARNSKGLWMMHCCVFPHLENNGPIFGFDVIAGKNKMTGAFLDFSPTVEKNHIMIEELGHYVSNLNWKKERELPDWAKAIFSNHMVAAGNISNIDEITQVTIMVNDMITFYLDDIEKYNNLCSAEESILSQNNYAYYQKQNPHTPKTMTALGLDEIEVKNFIENCLFPKIKSQ